MLLLRHHLLLVVLLFSLRANVHTADWGLARGARGIIRICIGVVLLMKLRFGSSGACGACCVRWREETSEQLMLVGMLLVWQLVVLVVRLLHLMLLLLHLLLLVGVYAVRGVGRLN